MDEPATATPKRTASLLAFFLVVGLSLIVGGCGGAGANEERGSNGGDDDGNGGGGETVVPAAPTGLTANAGDGSVELSWETSDEAEGYNVYRALESDVELTDPVAEDRTESTYSDTDVENGTTYHYVVTAVADEEGDPSGEAESTPFAPPSDLAGTSGDSQVELEWSAAAGAETYNVYRDTTSIDRPEGDPLTSGVSEAAYTDSTAENGTKYYYRVTSVNPESEESSASNEVGKAPFSDPPDRP